MKIKEKYQSKMPHFQEEILMAIVYLNWLILVWEVFAKNMGIKILSILMVKAAKKAKTILFCCYAKFKLKY